MWIECDDTPGAVVGSVVVLGGGWGYCDLCIGLEGTHGRSMGFYMSYGLGI